MRRLKVGKLAVRVEIHGVGNFEGLQLLGSARCQRRYSRAKARYMRSTPGQYFVPRQDKVPTATEGVYTARGKLDDNMKNISILVRQHRVLIAPMPLGRLGKLGASILLKSRLQDNIRLTGIGSVHLAPLRHDQCIDPDLNVNFKQFRKMPRLLLPVWGGCPAFTRGCSMRFRSDISRDKKQPRTQTDDRYFQIST